VEKIQLNQSVRTDQKIVITGAAGLVGQNLLVLLKEKGFTNIIAIDKHEANCRILKQLHPEFENNIVVADVGHNHDWKKHLHGAACVIQLHAQITGTSEEPFVANNIKATASVLEGIKAANVPYLIHISSSVVKSVAHDWYSETKRKQEELVSTSGIKHVILSPTLMFGWFDPKHLGWLSRFMAKIPIFPIPGHGKYVRQPLYARDFCRVIVRCLETCPVNARYDIVGREEVFYIDLIKRIKNLTGSRAAIVKIPYSLFSILLKSYAIFSSRPPFTAHQLKALTAGDYFTGVDIEKEFAIKPTPLVDAFRETFCHPLYSSVILDQTA
jgi:nucleoside-diphosphate-sugar epimerase